MTDRVDSRGGVKEEKSKRRELAACLRRTPCRLIDDVGPSFTVSVLGNRLKVGIFFFLAVGSKPTVMGLLKS